MTLATQNILSEEDLCNDCKEKIKKETKKLSAFSLLAPRRIAIKFLRLLCKDCKEKCVAKVRDKQK